MGYIILLVDVHDARKFACTGPFQNAVSVGLDCSRGMKRTVQVLTAHCVLKQSSYGGQPGHHARTCPLNRQGKQQQHILIPDSAKDAPAKHHAHHCSVCGAARHTHRHTHTHSRMRTHRQIQKRARIHTCAHTNTQTHARTHTHAQTHRHTRAHTHTRARIQARTHTRTHTHTHTCICTHTLRV